MYIYSATTNHQSFPIKTTANHLVSHRLSGSRTHTHPTTNIVCQNSVII